MMKDRGIKSKMIRYFLSRMWYVHMEVEVLARQRVTQSRKVITDIDVLCVYPDISGNLNLLLGDCKTVKSVSPISRALWMKGLMDFMHASKGFIVLSQKIIEKDHQLTASYLQIQLHSMEDFDAYASRTITPGFVLKSALGNIDNWDAFNDIPNKYPALRKFSAFGKNEYWNEEKDNNRLRHALLQLKQVRSELNPDNPLHLSVVLHHISLIALAANDIIVKLFNRYLLPQSKEELTEDLRILIWGGVENYNYLNDLRKKFGTQSGVETDLTLPYWDRFLEFIRSSLENPLSFNLVPLFLKEISFTFLNTLEEYDYASHISNQNPYIPSHSLKLIEYCVIASELPKEFIQILTKKVLEPKI